MRLLFLLFIVFIHSTGLEAQTRPDSTIEAVSVKKVKKGSIFAGKPGKSMLMSLAIPGAGQIYNKSYLRVPFVWAAVGGMGLVLDYNTTNYRVFRDAHKAEIDGEIYEPPLNFPDREILISITDISRLKTLRDQANADRQLSIVLFSLTWLANGIDAFVDAHLKDFDIDENLSFEISTISDDDPYAPMRTGVFVKF